MLVQDSLKRLQLVPKHLRMSTAKHCGPRYFYSSAMKAETLKKAEKVSKFEQTFLFLHKNTASGPAERSGTCPKDCLKLKQLLRMPQGFYVSLLHYQQC